MNTQAENHKGNMVQNMLSVGEVFRREREKLRLTIPQVEKATKIRGKYLTALESNNWDVFESKVYISGVIKNYARYLKIDIRKAQAYFRRDYERKEITKFKKNDVEKYITPQTKKVAISFFVGIFLIFFTYFAYQLFIFLSPPKVMITSPTQKVFRNVEKITVKGKTEKEASITIFGERVFPNKDGEFSYEFPVKKGKNELIIDVIGGNGKKTRLIDYFVIE